MIKKMAPVNDSAIAETVPPLHAEPALFTDDTPYRLLSRPTHPGSWEDATKEPPSDNDLPHPDGIFTPSQYTWNLVIGITASAVFVLVTAAVLFGLIAFKRFMKKRNRTLSADTGVFSPRRGSKAGLDMIDNAVVLTSHSSLQRSGSLRKQFQKLLSR